MAAAKALRDGGSSKRYLELGELMGYPFFEKTGNKTMNKNNMELTEVIIEYGEIFCRAQLGDSDEGCGKHFQTTGALCTHVEKAHSLTSKPAGVTGKPSAAKIQAAKIFFNGLMKLHDAAVSAAVEKQTRSNLVLGPHPPPSTTRRRRRRSVSPADRRDSPRRSDTEDTVAPPAKKNRAPRARVQPQAIPNVPKTRSKLKAGKTTKPLELPEVPAGPAYDIETRSKRVSKTKAQPGGHPELDDIVIYAPRTKSGKNQGSFNYNLLNRLARWFGLPSPCAACQTAGLTRCFNSPTCMTTKHFFTVILHRPETDDENENETA